MSPARCRTCQRLFESKAKAREHGKAVGHTGCDFACTTCSATFHKAKELKQHVVATGHKSIFPDPTWQAVSGTPVVASTTSVSQSVKYVCAECQALFGTADLLATHRQTEHQPVQSVRPCARCGRLPSECECLTGSATSNTCPLCLARFADTSEVAEHIRTAARCNSCKVCLPSGLSMVVHYWESVLHHKCRPCRLGFETAEAWAGHRAVCVNEEETHPVSAPSTVNASTSGRSTPVQSMRAPDSPGVDSFDASTIDPLKHSFRVGTSHTYADHSPSLHSKQADSHSISQSDVIPTRDEDDSEDISSGTRQSFRLSPERSRGDAATPKNISLSWHCRSCSRNPCVEPVTTICGHLFCRRCVAIKFPLSKSFQLQTPDTRTRHGIPE
ncbi:hypothetical protein C8Q74DRAFT_99905 [Fomes fomentarius]|nr:hypothetical protein C8Q74DRAFT_99905 [Fomes fomentarius]